MKSLNAQYGHPSCLQPPQMSNCVNQRMEFRVFERFADRDYTSRVMAVRWAPPSALKFGPLLTPPTSWKAPPPVM